MAVPNPNQITSTLRMMSDPQLRQYAAMHKNDPYIFPMAFAESNARKQARAAQQAQGMGQQQPKVVDQDLMEMGAPPPQMAPQGIPPQGGPQMAQQQLPEQQGIGALPAPNMQRMADGGIAGYGDDNEFNYAGADDSVVMMAGGGVAGYAGGGVTETLRAVLKELGIPASQYLNDIGVKQTVDTLVSERAVPTTPAAPATSAAATAPTAGTAYSAGKELGQKAAPYLNKAGKVIKAGTIPVIGGALAGYQGISDINNAQGFYDDPNVSTLEKAKQAGRTAVGVAAPYVGAAVGSGFAPVVGTLAGGAAGMGLAALVGGEGEALQEWRKANVGYTRTDPRALASMPSAADQLAEAAAYVPSSNKPTDKKLSTSSNIRPAASPTAPPAAVGTDYEARLKTLADASRPKVEGLEALAAQRKAAMEKLGVTGEVGDAQKLALEKEGAQAADDKKEMLWMALIKGGLAVAGGTSQHALKNIADGFGVGLEDAAKGMKELKLAEKERKRNLAAIEEARRAEKRGDVKDVIAAQEKSKDHLDNYNMHVMSSQTTFLGNQLQADSAMQVAKLHEQNANARSNAQIAATLNTPERQMWNQALKDHNGNTAAAFKELQSIKSEKFNAYQSYADYLKAFAGKETLQVPQDFSTYVSQFSVPTTTAPGKNATILKQP